MKTGIRKTILLILCAALAILWACLSAQAEEAGTELVILSTTDMHGKCWEKNILTNADVKQNMLRVSTAVQEIRQMYGDGRVVLIDNGDTFQGTPVSEVHLIHAAHPEGEDEAMALCLKEIGYDALIPGNHEFNYPWDVMRGVYEDLERNGVAVLAANAYYDGSDGVHRAGENVFSTRIIREITVNGHPHRIGILGLGNTDIARWDLPTNYPGIIFTDPEHPDYDLGEETGRWAARMRAEGCEMIIAAYHGGPGETGEPVAFAINSTNQGMRILKGTDCLDLLILGHDHSTSYSNTFRTDGAGRRVPVVNGGGQDLTKTVFFLTEDADGRLVCELRSTENLNLAGYEPDRALEEKIRPYAEQADAMMDEPIGLLAGEWDGSEEFHVRQNDTLDLISAALISIGTKRMNAKYGASGAEALRAAGLDHPDIDAVCSTAVNGGYIAHSGAVTIRDIYRMYRFANNLLVIPMYGRDIRAVMEENASERLTARILNGKAYFYPRNDPNTHLIFGGINFRYDLSAPAGERVAIEGFSNGRAFDPDAVYLVAVNNFILNNAHCGLRAFSEEDALWSQTADDAGGTVQDLIQEYITDQCADGGSVTRSAIGWHWEIVYSADPAALPPYDGPAAASLAPVPLEGHRYVLYQESSGCSMTGRQDGDGLAAAGIPAWGNQLVETLPGDVLVFCAHPQGEDTLLLTDPQGRYLTCGRNGGLRLTEEAEENDLSLWQLIPAEGGYYLKSAGAQNDQMLEYYGGKINTYRMNAGGQYLFNFYEVNDAR